MISLINPLILALFFLQFASFLLLLLLRQICKNLSEKLIMRIVVAEILLSISLVFAIAVIIFLSHPHHYLIDVGTWFSTEDSKYEIIFIADILGVVYALFSLVMIGIIAVFSRRYLHRESGYYRFYTCLALFMLGVQIISFGGTMEIMIIGWEFVGLSSVLLISFFNYRQAPVQNAFIAFVNYRICDIGLFAAVLVMHNKLHNSDFQTLATAHWLGVVAHGAPLILGFLLLFGAMGKSALFPFSGWLTRAMEGPTPSSAIFYGAISVHFGPFLLLRCADLIAQSPSLSLTIIAVGLITALIARIVGHVQTDIKTMIAYGSIMQVGIIVTEIGLGWNMLALLHIVGHSGFRTLQMLRAPSIIHDLRNITQMLGHDILPKNIAKKPRKWSYILYHFALERGCTDAILKDYIIATILAPFHKLDRLEKKWRQWLTK